MSKPVVKINLQGRWGNTLFQVAFARAYCERHGFELVIGNWIGRQIFDGFGQEYRNTLGLTERNETTLIDGEGDIALTGYFQQQRWLDYYSRWQVKEWFAIKPKIEKVLRNAFWPPFPCLAHRRVGDYIGYGYPVVSKKSYQMAANKFNLGYSRFVTEENPVTLPTLPDFLPDFYMMMDAEVLLRGNSCFSWWAGALGHGKVYSPIIDGLEGGKEHDCEFVEGNWPRLANFDFVTTLHLRET